MVEAGEKPLVTITGVTGFLGSMVALEFLKDGGFRVRGTVRDTKNEKKIGPLRAGLGEHFKDIELVEADLLDEPSIISACAGATYVVHTASPFFFSDDEDKLVKPAVDGTLAVMRACSTHGVKRCVVTSSGAAISAVAKADKPKPGEKWNESYWSNVDREEGINNYFKSKTLAEKAAWDYVEKAAEGQKFELAVINPFLILGPSVCSGDGFSEGWMKNWLNGSKDKIPRSNVSFVDVRDTALAHLKAIQVPEAAGQRFILCGHDAWQEEVAKALGAKFPQLKIPKELADGENPDPGFGMDNTRS